jgi:hypothetical protein
MGLGGSLFWNAGLRTVESVGDLTRLLGWWIGFSTHVLQVLEQDWPGNPLLCSGMDNSTILTARFLHDVLVNKTTAESLCSPVHTTRPCRISPQTWRRAETD